MRILFLARSLDYGGAERQLAALAEGLHDRGHAVSVVLFYGGAPLEEELRGRGIRVEALGKSGRWDLVGFLPRLARLIRQYKPEVLHSYLADPNVAAALVRGIGWGPKLVWGVRASRRDLRSYERFVRLVFALQCRLSGRADLIIANSHAGRADHVAAGFPADRTVVIHNGFDTARIARSPEAGARVRSELGITPEERVVGLVARLSPMKDHPVFLRAAACLAEQVPDARFLCVGNGPSRYREELFALADKLGIGQRVVWADARPDITAVYSALDVLVSSSCWGEGFSNVIAEAMACRVPCAVTDVGESRHIVGDTGAVVSSGDYLGLAAGVSHLLRQEPSELARRGEAARERIVEEFSVERLVQRTEERLLRLLPSLPEGTA